jgi:hypothetical protein
MSVALSGMFPVIRTGEFMPRNFHIDIFFIYCSVTGLKWVDQKGINAYHLLKCII